MEFQNQVQVIDNLPKYQNVELTPINKKYKWVIILHWVLFTLILTGGNIFAFYNSDLKPYLTEILISSIIISLLWIISQLAAFSRRSFAVRDHDIIYRHGIVSTITTIIPYRRIQHIAINEGFFLRIFRLSSLQIFTAGGSSDDLKIKGISKEEGTQIKDFILTKIK